MKSILSALLSGAVLAVVCLIGAQPAAATTLTMDFKGYLTGTFTSGGMSYDDFGTDVNGQFTFSDISSTFGSSTGFDHASWTITVDGIATTSGTRDFPGGTVSIANPGSQIDVNLYSAFGDFSLAYQWGPTAQLFSLADFPTKQSIAASLYGWVSGAGNFFKGGSTYIFNIFAFNASVTTTPIPGALWLFASALIGIGGMGWRRQRLAGAAA